MSGWIEWVNAEELHVLTHVFNLSDSGVQGGGAAALTTGGSCCLVLSCFWPRSMQYARMALPMLAPL